MHWKTILKKFIALCLVASMSLSGFLIDATVTSASIKTSETQEILVESDNQERTIDGSESGNTEEGTTDGSESGNTEEGTTDGSESGSTEEGTTDGNESGSTEEGTTDRSESGSTEEGTTDGSESGNTEEGTTDGSESGNVEEETTDESKDENVEEETTDESGNIEEDEIPVIRYRAHVSESGWQDYVQTGMAGTTGRNLAMEALQVSIDGIDKLDIEYQAHVSEIGWQSYVSNGEIAGTTGKALPIEAMKLRLTGELADQYDLYYRVHVTNFGWLAWAEEDEVAGTAGYAYTVQAIEIQLVPVGEEAPAETSRYKSHYDSASVSFDIEKSDEDGKAVVKIADVDGIAHMTNMKVAVWSDGAQRDLVWYTAERKNGNWYITVDVAMHGYNFTKYHVHVYAKPGLANMRCVGMTDVEFVSQPSGITLVKDKAETMYVVSLPKRVVASGVKNVRFAVWSDANGQDDLKWYSATSNVGTYSAQIDIKNHKTLGKYQIHAYGTNSAGVNMLIGATSELQVTGTAKGNVAIIGQDKTSGLFTVAVDQLKAASGISSVKVAVWTAANGQDEIAWYEGKKQSNGTYRVDVDIADHKFESGNYVIHVYATMGNGIDSYVAATNFTFNPEGYLAVLKNSGDGKRTLVLKSSKSLSSVKFAVWSTTKGQDDIVWYNATQASDGTWRATIKSSNHKNAGEFLVHAYSGSNIVTGRTFDFPQSEFAKNGWFYETINGRTYKLYYTNNVLQKNVTGILGPQSTYKAEINRKTCTVTIYAKDGANGYIIPVIAFTCSVGLPSTPTPVGTFYTSEKKRWGELMGPSYGQYCTRIVAGILFHSVAGSHMSSYNLSAANYNMLGQPASHGCVRLCVRDAKWIYDNCKLGMQVDIFDSSYAGPFGKPATIKIPASQNWDPTDPNV